MKPLLKTRLMISNIQRLKISVSPQVLCTPEANLVSQANVQLVLNTKNIDIFRWLVAFLGRR